MAKNRNEEIKAQPKKVQRQRLSVCAECPHLIASIQRCRLCGCKVADRAKMTDRGCPLLKWPGDL